MVRSFYVVRDRPPFSKYILGYYANTRYINKAIRVKTNTILATLFIVTSANISLHDSLPEGTSEEKLSQ